MNDKVAQVIQDRDYEAGECSTSWIEAGEHTRDYYRETARLVLSLETKTHRIAVIKKGEPPLLDEMELAHISSGSYANFAINEKHYFGEVARRQRSSDIEYYKGVK